MSASRSPAPAGPHRALRKILVTGATGNVGREVVRCLLRAGVAVRAAGQATSRVAELFGADVEAISLDFEDAATFGATVRGCDGVFLLRPPAIAAMKRTLVPFVETARTVGAEHIVFLSVAGADKNSFIPHHAVEKHLARRPGTWTLLRPGFFAQNFGDAYRRDLRDDARLFVPAGKGRVAFVDVRDVAEVAALSFADPGVHHGKAYTLTGPEAVTFGEAARILSAALGREIRYEPATVLGYVAHLRRRGMPLPQIAVQTVLHVGLRFGQAEAVDPTLRELLGRPPRTVQEYVADHVSHWQR